MIAAAPPPGWIERWHLRKRLQSRTPQAVARSLAETRGATGPLYPAAAMRPTASFFLGVTVGAPAAIGLWVLFAWSMGWV